jgi:hypothetical protein
MATTYTLISSVTVGSGGTTNITFSSIPQTYTDLVIKVCGKPDINGTGALGIQFNSTTTTYTNKRLYGDGSSAQSDSASTTNYLNVGLFGNSSGTSNFGNTEVYIPNYTFSNQKSVSTDSVSEGNTTTQYMTLQAGLWNGTGAITSIKLGIDNDTSNFVQYSTAYLYGISNA